MSSPKPGETAEQRQRRLLREKNYRERRRLRDAEGFKAANRENARRWRLNHPEKAKTSVLRWREQNKDRSREAGRNWRRANIVRNLYTDAKSRAKKRGIEFSIALADIPEMGELCPVFGRPFIISADGRCDDSPSLDRIRSDQGYVPGNVWIIGYRANRVKNDATADEHEMIAWAMRRAITHVVRKKGE